MAELIALVQEDERFSSVASFEEACGVNKETFGLDGGRVNTLIEGPDGVEGV